jgi:hypothetical protein
MTDWACPRFRDSLIALALTKGRTCRASAAAA